MQLITRFFYIIAIFAIASCKNLPSTKDLTITNWQASGKVSVLVDKNIYPQAERSQQTLNFSWQQQGDDFIISLSGSFGFGKTLIRKKSDIVSVERGSTILGRANNPEQLLTNTTGLRLPISGLQYWILGLPSTPTDLPLHTNASLGCGDAGVNPCAIPNFNDKGWEIVIPSSQNIKQHVLPRRLKASVEGMSLNAVLNQWSAAPDAALQKP